MVKLSWSEQQIRRVSAESMVDVRTIKRALKGESIRKTSSTRISEAAKKLGLRTPAFVLGMLMFGCGLDSEGLGLFGSSSTNEAGGAAGQAGLAGAAGGGSAGQSGQDASSEACAPKTCAELGYVCGTGQDGCGNTLVCGPLYERHPGEDYPWQNTTGQSCPADYPHSWACGAYPAPGGDPPYPDCVQWPDLATWCCAQEA